MSPRLNATKPLDQLSDSWLLARKRYAQRGVHAAEHQLARGIVGAEAMKVASETLLREIEAEMARRESAAALLPKPPLSCSCAEWEPCVAKINAPILLAQARNPHLTNTPEFQFVAFRYCPWCGKKLLATPRENQA